VRLVARKGLKPVLNTNGLALTPKLLGQLKLAGLRGLTFHVDSLQRRPGWTGKSELELNELRQQYADMAAAAGGLSCAFNATVYEKTLDSVPEIVAWAARNPDRVQVVVFIAFRSTTEDGRFDYYAGDRKVETRELSYRGGRPERIDIDAREIASAIRSRFPGFQPSAYLNGTEKADAFKWLLTVALNDGKGIVGSLGPKTVELAQMMNHLFSGRYLGYVSPDAMRWGKAMLPLAAVDSSLKSAAKTWLGRAVRSPAKLLQPLFMQSIMIIQPVDVMADGRTSMCDGCPDMTVYEGELVWSCRLEEKMEFGQWMRPVPKDRAGAASP
jgi:hypothetical protein